MHMLRNLARAGEDLVLLAGMAVTALGAVIYAWWHAGVLPTFVVATVLLVVGGLTATFSQSGRLSRLVLPVLAMFMAALLIQADVGNTVAHFAIFALLGATAVYRSILAPILAAATIALHHVLFNFLQSLSWFQIWGWSPLCFTTASWSLVVEHALYVVAETAVLVLLAQRAASDFAVGQVISDIARHLVGEDGRVNLHLGAFERVAEPRARQLLQVLGTIGELVDETGSASAAIHAASIQIAHGNDDLSRRTQEQAASLQQTASSMEQMTATIKLNADHAQQAGKLSKDARDRAVSGGAVVAEAMQAMAEIRAASEQIGNILGLINDIAFQTNLLALNAAVEAARAGEHGRGFAVVASEVRALAQRSATASRDIRDLIAHSTDRVRLGSELVHRSGTVLEEIVQSITTVNDRVAEMVIAGAEQSAGIEQVGRTVQKMDSTLQQNAALVEQASAASRALQDQAGLLKQQVSAFRLAA